ncbi:YczE/YyaS/YitT family protein [Sporosarcina limicola]|uniref:Membrane protein YczE n=1 Tax=Sporosarcina limicola TaxID=34101 RepID=A0A927ME93_9BACL|nr:YitT family protein [Sporosarcina limicola]MBE1552950.1 putative membrane protein YczE [Sporosarcina limicola]
MRKILFWRWAFFLGGLLIVSLGISMTIKGQRLGIGPWDVLHVGLYQKFGLTIGTWGIITGFVIIIATAMVLKEWPKIGTWLNMLLLGIFIDIFNWLLPDFTTLIGQITIFIIGIVVMSYGVGVYVSPNIGAGPRDSLMLLLVDKLGISVKRIRTMIEVVVALLGWLLGGPVGVGTVIIALLIGQFVHYTLPQSRKLLLKLIGEEDEKILF